MKRHATLRYSPEDPDCKVIHLPLTPAIKFLEPEESCR